MSEAIQPDHAFLPADGAAQYDAVAGPFNQIDAAPLDSSLAHEVPPDSDEVRRSPATLSTIVAVGAFVAIYATHGLVCGRKKVSDAEAAVIAANNLPKGTPGKTKKVIDALHAFADAEIAEQKQKEAELRAADRKRQAPNN